MGSIILISLAFFVISVIICAPLMQSALSTPSSFFGGPTQGGSPGILSNNATKPETSEPSQSPSSPAPPNASGTTAPPPLVGSLPGTTTPSPTTPTTNETSNNNVGYFLNNADLRAGHIVLITRYSAPESNGTIALVNLTYMEVDPGNTWTPDPNAPVPAMDYIITTDPRFESLIESATLTGKEIGYTGQRENPPGTDQILERINRQPFVAYKIDTLTVGSE